MSPQTSALLLILHTIRTNLKFTNFAITANPAARKTTVIAPQNALSSLGFGGGGGSFGGHGSRTWTLHCSGGY